MKKLNFTKLKITDIEGKPLSGEQEIHKLLANAIYMNANSIELAEIAKKIHQGEEVELRDNEVEEIVSIVENEQKFPYIALVKRSILDFIKK